MFKKILGTGLTRVLNLLIGFATMLMGTKVLGAAEWGIGFTVLTDVTFLLIGVEFIVGGGLVYFTSRKPLSTLMKVSYGWIVLVMAFYVLAFWILSYFPDLSDSIVPRGYEWITLLLTFVYSFHNFNLNILLGKEKVGTYNWVFLLQILVQVGTMALLIFVFHLKDARAFVYSLLCGYVVALLAGLTQVLPMLNRGESKPILATAKEMLAYNSVIVLTSLVSILNRRLSVFMLRQKYTDNDKEVGVYGTGTQVGEAVKVFGVSIAMVQFSHLSNLKDKDEAVNLTIKFLKISVILTFIALLVLACLPVSFFEWIFSKEFGQVKQIILLMAPGMLFYSAHSIFTHYFSGTGVPKYNLFASLVGLGVTLPCTLTMIPHWGIFGAAASFSATFLAIMLYQWFVFRRIAGVRAKNLLLTKEDWTWCKEEFYAIFAKNKN
ncbi:MAG: polysaccharide biosynthesis C-terminal domain-containing protein [Bacteroidales bacterium]|nr:polysaccharide biosynthesis C-terminal domain-containing protein [Bacteroidales bacterium]MBQ3709101.1 polysaccharide biosynthesis C-terminal domain-containing protein [Bacteroidales bacterium]